MSKEGILAIVVSMMLLAAVLFYVPSVKTAPRSDLQFLWGFSDPDRAYMALKSGEVDILCMDLTLGQKEDAEADPYLQICRYSRNGYFEFALNNNKTIISYPDKLSPTNVKEVRQAMAYLINKTYILSEIVHFQGERIDQPIPYPQTERWCDPSVITYDWNHNGIIDPEEDNYPYKYNPDMAVRMLANLGFNDTDGNGYLNYPNDPMWMGAAGLDTTQMPLKIVAPSENPYKSGCAKHLYRQLEGDPAIAGDSLIATSPIWSQYGLVGGDFDTTDEMWIAPWLIIRQIVAQLNFHVYIWDGTVGRFPLHLYFIYHSGPSSITGYEHPELDLYLEQLYYASNIFDAQTACRRACKYMAEHAVTIPLWSPVAYQSWRKGVAGVVNMKGYGINNKYTYINAYREDVPGAPLRIAIPWAYQFNVIYSMLESEWEVLNAIYPHLLNINPYDFVDQPWIAQDWEVNLQMNYTTFWIRRDAGIGTPNPIIFPTNYTAHDVEFTIWYTYAFQDGRNWPLVKDIYYTKTLDDHTIQIYFHIGTMSFWQQYNIGSLPLLCDEIIPALSNAPLYPLLAMRTYSFIFPNQNKLPDHVVRVISATADGIPIYEGKNFTIRTETNTYRRDLFVPENINLELPWNITITYWYAPNRPTGKYLGSDAGLTWYDTMYTPGPHYVSGYSEISVYLSKNSRFFLSPPLGEVDWRWYWVEGPKPRSGYFEIDILDVVLACIAYDSRGDGEYDPNYFPGADLNGDCLIDIVDVVIITMIYELTFGTPP